MAVISLDALPNELLLPIYKLLDNASAFRLGCASRRLRMNYNEAQVQFPEKFLPEVFGLYRAEDQEEVRKWIIKLLEQGRISAQWTRAKKWDVIPGLLGREANLYPKVFSAIGSFLERPYTGHEAFDEMMEQFERRQRSRAPRLSPTVGVGRVTTSPASTRARRTIIFPWRG
jgi:hypothetical protein